jgi:UDP-N-acetylmuramoyl-L-alanyl-D-glutamate--2,6-diaminopimelate ligase
MVKEMMRKLAGKKLLKIYHFVLAWLANYYYGQPTKKMVIVGVTGTNGKTTVVNLISWILQENGYKTASSSTAQFFVNGQSWLNNLKMTMPGRFQLQKFLSEAKKQNCRYVVIETSSEGIKQNRHYGIHYDVAVLTNLTPEHIEAHGSFANYRQAKMELWHKLITGQEKNINGQIVKKFSIINADSPQAPYFLQITGIKHYTYGLEATADYSAEQIEVAEKIVKFVVCNNLNEQTASVNYSLPGKINIYNSLAAIACCQQLGVSLSGCQIALSKYPGTPGRFEFINNQRGFAVMVDYAHEPEAMNKLYETLSAYSYERIIHVLGSCGGGRDQARRPILGEMAGQKAQVVIVTNEDPYDDDPMNIINEVAIGVKKSGLNQKNILIIEDREQAIKKAIEIAQKNDLVLITGKGAEQWLCVAKGKKIPWDDREVAKKYLSC